MFKSIFYVGASLLLTGGLLTVAPAQTSSSSMSKSASSQRESSQTSTKMNVEDTHFMKKAAEGNTAEVELGKLAEEKASNQQVKQFGERMVNDHSKANEELQKIAESKGVTLPNTPSAKDKADETRLSKLSGERFDRAYMAEMRKDHTKDVSEFRMESKSAHDPQLKQFAEQTLPTLESHLKEADSIKTTQGSQRSAMQQPSTSK
jgi:putative membrane protein